MFHFLTVALILGATALCIVLIWTGATAFTARGLRWSKTRYLHGTTAYAVGIPLFLFGIAGIVNLAQRAIELDVFSTPEQQRPAPPSRPADYRTIASRPQRIPAGAHVDGILGFYIVPPAGYPPEPGMMSPIVARFKEKLEGDEIEHRVAVAREPRPAGITLEQFFNSELEKLKKDRTTIIESGDAKFGDHPCKYYIARDKYVTASIVYMYLDEHNLWMALSVSARKRLDEPARKLLRQSIETFRTFEMANSEAKKP